MTDHEFDPQPGLPVQLQPGLRRILAPNPSPMTHRGTNTYLLGTRDVAVIDPGPLDESHLGAILAALSPDQRISHIIVTHSHLDHSPLAAPLAKRTGAPILAFGGPEAGRSPVAGGTDLCINRRAGYPDARPGRRALARAGRKGQRQCIEEN